MSTFPLCFISLNCVVFLQVHQSILPVRKGKDGWIDIICPGGVSCFDEGHFFSHVVSSFVVFFFLSKLNFLTPKNDQHLILLTMSLLSQKLTVPVSSSLSFACVGRACRFASLSLGRLPHWLNFHRVTPCLFLSDGSLTKLLWEEKKDSFGSQGVHARPLYAACVTRRQQFYSGKWSTVIEADYNR